MIDHMTNLKILITMVCTNFINLVVGESVIIMQLPLPSKNFAIQTALYSIGLGIHIVNFR